MRLPVQALLLASLLGTFVLGGCRPTMPPGIKYTTRPPASAVSLSPGASEILLITSVHPVGRTSADDYPANIKSVPIVANIKPDYEKIAALRPDVIIYDPSVYNSDDVEKLKALHIPLATIEGDTVADYITSLYKLGTALQSETSILDYIDRLQKVITDCRADALVPAPKTAIVLPSPNSNPMIAGTKSYYADIVRIAGGDPIGPDSNKFEPIGAEALLALNPDAIVVPAAKGDYGAFMTDPRFAQLKAVKTGKIVGISEDYILRRGERADVALLDLHNAFIKLFK